MKKLLLSLCLSCCVVAAVSAQEITDERSKGTVTTKSGQYILPVAGDFAIGIQMNPFLNYFGNMFNNTANNQAPWFGNNGVEDLTLYGKYFLEDNIAIRAKLHLNIGSAHYQGTVTNDELVGSNPLNSLATTIDTKKDGFTEISLNIGYELRRGYGRLQGFYGAEVMLGYEGGSIDYEYGNPMTALNQAPSSTMFESDPVISGPMGSRPIHTSKGTAFHMGLGAFAGVEYFIAPKLSIGGEIGLGFMFSRRGQTETEVEAYEAQSNRVITLSQRARNANEIAGQGVLSTRTNWSLFAMFHF